MGKIAFVFPGQGSQYVGMGKDLFDAEPAARALFDEADRIINAPFSSICFQGPEPELRQTSLTQPAIFVHSIAVATLLPALKPDMVAGHSLGEYSALVVAGAMTFPDALRLVRLRGELMQRAGTEHPGTMAAIVGLDQEAVQELCREASDAGIVQAANLNAPGQVVISGSVEGVRRGMDLAKQRGARLVKELVVSGAFHSPLMAGAGDGLRRELERTTIRDARIPVYANVTAGPVTRGAEIRELLHRQLTSPVRWEESIRAMAADGATAFFELGPGKVLQGLTKRTLAGVTTGGWDTLNDIRTQGTT
jgi:[acyl-carrier-protein] S-malonyltransferase